MFPANSANIKKSPAASLNMQIIKKYSEPDVDEWKEKDLTLQYAGPLFR